MHGFDLDQFLQGEGPPLSIENLLGKAPRSAIVSLAMHRWIVDDWTLLEALTTIAIIEHAMLDNLLKQHGTRSFVMTGPPPRGGFYLLHTLNDPSREAAMEVAENWDKVRNDPRMQEARKKVGELLKSERGADLLRKAFRKDGEA